LKEADDDKDARKDSKESHNSKKIIVSLIITLIAALITSPFINDKIKHDNDIQETKKFMSNEIKYAQIQITEGFPEKAIQSCNMAIKEYNNLSTNDKERFKLEYSIVQYISGIAYYNISMCRDRCPNLEKAIQAFNESLFSNSPTYKDVLINLSVAYLDMSRIKNMEDNLNEAIRYINKYLYISEENDEYVRALVIRGNAYRYLSEVRNKQENLKKSINDYESALTSLDNLNLSASGKYEIDLGDIRSNLGSSYRFLSEIEDPRNNLDKSMDNNSIALEILCGHSDELAHAKHNRGALYLTYYNYYLLCNPLAEVNNEQLRYYLNKAIIIFNESLHIQDQCSLERIDTMINMEYAKVLLSGRSSNYKNKIDDSIAMYKQVLLKYNKSEYPIKYAKINNYLGAAFFYRARVSKSEIDLIKSINYFNESLSVWNEDEYPLNHAETSKNLGLAYKELADVGDNKSSLEKAKGAFRNAANIWQSDRCSMDYAYAEYLLGRTYLGIYKIDKDYLSAIEATNAFQNSLSFFDEREYPEMSKSIKNYINNTIDPPFF